MSWTLALALALAGGGGAQLDGEEEEAVDFGVFEAAPADKIELGDPGGGRLHLRIGDLEEKLDGLPVGEQGAIGR